MLEIDLLRHGQCEGGDIFRGSTDVALTEEGRVAMHQRLAAWPDMPWQQIISSPLTRCQSFARTLADNLGCPLLLLPELREMHFGDWESQLIAEVWQQQGDALNQWRTDCSRFTPPGGELFTDFAQRVEAAMAGLVNTHCNQRVLVVTHGGVMRLLLIRALGLPVSAMAGMHVPYAALVRLRWTAASGWQLLEQHPDAQP